MRRYRRIPDKLHRRTVIRLVSTFVGLLITAWFCDRSIYAGETDQFLAGPFLPLIIGVGLSILAYFLFRPDAQDTPVQRQQATTLTQRGAYVPLLKGRALVGPVFANAWGRYTVEEIVGDGGKEDDPTQTAYFENGWHQIAVGCGLRCHGIQINGEVIPNTTFDRINTPSGSLIDLGSHGALRWYWGEGDDRQPVDPTLAADLGFSSRFPFLMHAVWVPRRLGFSAVWDDIKYDVECANQLTGFNTAENEYGGQPAGDGFHPAWLLWELWSAAFPHGGGMPRSWMDFGAIDQLGTDLNSNLSSHLLAKDGMTLEQAINAIVSEYRIAMPEIFGVICPKAYLESDTAITLNDQILSPPLDELIRKHGFERAFEQIIFEYLDAAWRFKIQTVKIDDDSIKVDGPAIVRPRSVPIMTAIHQGVAALIANDRYLEVVNKPQIVRMTGARQTRHIWPGHAVSVTTGAITRNYRLLEVTPSFDSPATQLGLAADVYTADQITYTPPVNEPPGYTPAVEDTAWRLLEVPRKGEPNEPAVAVLRVTGGADTIRSQIFASADGLSYTLLGTQTHTSVGGVVDGAFSPRDNRLRKLTRGPDVAIYTVSEDVDGGQLLDLTGDRAGVLTGRQMLICFDSLGRHEIFFVTRLEASGNSRGGVGNIWYTHEVIRARFDTAPLDFADGAEAYILDSRMLRLFRSPEFFGIGNGVFMKNQPTGLGGGPKLEDIAAKSITITGRYRRPAAARWFVCGGSYDVSNPSTYSRRDNKYADSSGLGEGLVLEWIPGEVDLTRGAGCVAAGTAHGTRNPMSRVFVTVELWNGSSYILLGTHQPDVTDQTGIIAWEYTRALRIADGANGFGDGVQELRIGVSYEVDGTISDPAYVFPLHVNRADIGL